MASVGTGIVLATIDGSIVNVALPTLVRAFATDLASVEWVALAYLLATTTLMLSMGRLGDMLGKKPVYITGLPIFTAGSALCGLAPTIGVLIASRVVQAVGAAMIMSLGMAIITEAFPPKDRGKALGVAGSLVSLAFILGPTVGGVLVGALSWHWIFLVNLPVGAFGIYMAARFIPKSAPCGPQRFDFAGAGTLFVGLLSLLLALTLGQNRGFAAPEVLGLFALAAVLIGLFVVHRGRVDAAHGEPEPLPQLALRHEPHHGAHRVRVHVGHELPGALLPAGHAGVRPGPGGPADDDDAHRRLRSLPPVGLAVGPLRHPRHRHRRPGLPRRGLRRGIHPGRQHHGAGLPAALLARGHRHRHVPIAQQQRRHGRIAARANWAWFRACSPWRGPWANWSASP